MGKGGRETMGTDMVMDGTAHAGGSAERCAAGMGRMDRENSATPRHVPGDGAAAPERAAGMARPPRSGAGAKSHEAGNGAAGLEYAGLAVADRITSASNIYGVVGYPIAHSLSPQIHNTLARVLGANMVYLAFAPEPRHIRSALKGLFEAGVLGLNVTMPFKGDAYAFAGSRHPDTDCFMAANTLVAAKDGAAKDSAAKDGAAKDGASKSGGAAFSAGDNADGTAKSSGVRAYNTDFGGFVNAFSIQAGRSFEGMDVLILGSGASSRTLAFAVAGQGAKSVMIAGRARDKARGVAELGAASFAGCNFSHACYSDKEMPDIIAQSGAIINTTPVGMNSEQRITPGGISYAFKPSQYAVDLIYSPKETYFLWNARHAGATAINGLGMLICQAALAFELFTGIAVPKRLLAEMFPLFQRYVDRHVPIVAAEPG
jgi:shikimate dehydrogenase